MVKTDTSLQNQIDYNIKEVKKLPKKSENIYSAEGFDQFLRRNPERFNLDTYTTTEIPIESVTVETRNTIITDLDVSLESGTGIGISTDASTGKVTITNTLPNQDQDLWYRFRADSGGVVADSTTDTFTITGGEGIDTEILGDELTIEANLSDLGDTFLRLDGANEPMTGLFRLAGDPTNDLHPATKQYVDEQVLWGIMF